MCAECALDLELESKQCPFCRISYDKWRAVHNMEVEDPIDGIADLFRSPAPPTPPRAPSPTADYLRERREGVQPVTPLTPLFAFGGTADLFRAFHAPTSTRAQEEPTPIRRRPRTPSGCQYVFTNAERVCNLRGPRAIGTDGKQYCEAHLEDGPSSAADRAREERLKHTLAINKEKNRVFLDKRRRAAKLEEAERKAAEAQRILEVQAQVYRQM